jgi:N-acetylgalactosamine-N,N'-diacetylbacillosaminyl-diphospho-undecaprenol 4-alpha-N-acetylgalactosaminyltransferase
LEKLIRELNLENDVHLMGWQDNPFRFLANSRLFILSSLREAFPTVILEAMACGIPVVSVDCKGGLREILTPNNGSEYGILTPPLDKQFYNSKDPLTKSEKSLSGAIIKVCENRRLKDSLSQKSKERAKDFEPKKIVKQWIALMN